MTENYTWILFSKCLSGEASPVEKEQLQELLLKDDVLCRKYDVLQQFWNSSSAESSVNNEAASIKIILEKAAVTNTDLLPVKPARKYKKRFAAGLFLSGLLITATLLVNSGKLILNKSKQQVHQMSAALGARNRVVLPDGSLVFLNSGSEISYKNKNGKREVTLTGEAYFDVKKLADKEPFIVHVNGTDIKVLGTTFDVKSYKEDKTVETVLLKGLIEITGNGVSKDKPLYLHPNERLVMKVEPATAIAAPVNKYVSSHESKQLTIYKLDSAVDAEDRIETAWMYNRLEFRNLTFSELAPRLERWYNIHVKLQDEEVKQLSFNGSFEGETPEQAFAALAAAVPFNYTINNNEILVRSFEKTAP